MMTRTCVHLFRLIFVACLVSAGCSPRGIPPGAEDKYGCEEPPPDTFTSAGVDVHFAQSMYPKVVIGDVDIKTNPSVVSLSSQAVRDARIRDKIRCLARKRDQFTPTQVMYLDGVNAFLATNPTPENFMKWQEKHPFPARSDDQIKELEDVDQLREQLERVKKELRDVQERSNGRRLTASQWIRFVNAISKAEKDEIEVSFVNGNPESERFAYDIALALQESGWKVANMVSAIFLGGTPVGVRVMVKDPQLPSLVTLLPALQEIDPKVQLKVNPKLDRHLKLDVGSKP